MMSMYVFFLNIRNRRPLVNCKPYLKPIYIIPTPLPLLRVVIL